MILKTIRITSLTVSLGLAIIISLMAISAGFAQDQDPYIRRVPSMESDTTDPINPLGLAYSSQSERFYITEAQGTGSPLAATSEVIAISPLADRLGTSKVAAGLEDPLNMVFDNQNDRLLAYQPSTGQLIEVRENPGTGLDQTFVVPHSLDQLGIQEPRGLAFDQQNRILFILDAAEPQIVRLEAGPGRSFSSGQTSTINLESSGIVAPRGIAFDPTSGHLHVLDTSDQSLYELDGNGRVVATRDLLPFHLQNPGAMVFAPSGDQTDDPTQMSLFVADSGTSLGGGTSGSETQDSSQVQGEAFASPGGNGQIVEFSLLQPAAAAVASFTSSLVKTTNLAAISPPSPDASGISYLPANNRLMVVDGEVEETVNGITHFQGANVWELTLSGAVLRTANISAKKPTVVPMSDEPTDVTWNQNNGHYYFSDDTGSIDVYDLNPGPDGLVGTSDDSWTGFSTAGYGNNDAEGITYDPWHNHLFVADGVNAEIYEYTLSGSLVHQFDVRSLGVVDPEAVEFNPVSGTLYVMSSNQNSPLVIETTTSGALLQTIDISSAHGITTAGLAYAPASDGSGVHRFYIVDRGIDNNDNPNIIDGKMYEMTTPPLGATATPSNTPPPGGTFTFTPTSTPGNEALYVSFALSGNIGGVSFADDDILRYDGQSWSMLFDGSDIGAGSVDLFALTVLDPDSFLLVFSNTVTLSGGLTVEPGDIVRFDATSLGDNTAGTFSLFFDGSDVGLSTSGEKLDSLSLLPDGRIVISTTGNLSVPGLSANDEDLVAFAPTSLGDNTSGSWSLYFDGSDVGLADASSEDIDALDLVGSDIYLSTTGDFAVDGLSGAGEDLFTCSPTSLGDLTACSFAPSLFFDGSAWGVTGISIDGFDLVSTGSAPSATPAATSTNTPTPTVSSTSTDTNTPTSAPPTFTSTNTPTQTSKLPSDTPTNTSTSTLTFTATSTSTPTDTPAQTPTFTATSSPPANTPTPTFTATNTPTSVSGNEALYVSFALSGNIGGVSFADDDILRYDGQSWSMLFDGSDIGAGSVDLFALTVLDPDSFLLVFSNTVTLSGGLTVEPGDIVRFDATSLGDNTAGTFSLFFDGSDVGLDDASAEKIDSLSLLPDGRIVISTTGNFAVDSLTARDEDLEVFAPTSLGDNTSGSWSLYFDGSDVGLADASSEDIDALDLVGSDIYLSTIGDFAVDGLSGAGEDLFTCSPTSLGDLTACSFAPSLFFDGSAWGVTGISIDGFDLAPGG